MDASGEVQTDVTSTMFKTRLNENGNVIGKAKLEVSSVAEAPPEGYCGPCYGGKSPREDECCNSCKDVRDAYQAKGWAITDYNAFEQCAREQYRTRSLTSLTMVAFFLFCGVVL
jgi:endoplasmic reticulum-Golgi intermediate compartment protein 3